ncbi:MAG: PRC-barrel domain-containing protein [Rhodomicrobiaceae bacterium]
MLWDSEELRSFSIAASDGEIGSVDDLLFDDESWRIRWLVLSTGGWINERQVLLPPHSLGKPDLAAHTIPVGLTREQIRNSPELDSDAPLSRQVERQIYDYYGWKAYWTSSSVPPLATGVPDVDPSPPSVRDLEIPGQPILRSLKEVKGYYIRASNGDIGHVDGFLIEDLEAVRYLVIDTKNWWPGKKVLISARWVQDVSWTRQQISIAPTREQVEQSPEYDGTGPVERAYEERLHRHYGYDPYW